MCQFSRKLYRSTSRGADRVELCAGISEGGTTPSSGEIALARKLLEIRLHVIIRPRGGETFFTTKLKAISWREIFILQRKRV